MVFKVLSEVPVSDSGWLHLLSLAEAFSTLLLPGQHDVTNHCQCDVLWGLSTSL